MKCSDCSKCKKKMCNNTKHYYNWFNSFCDFDEGGYSVLIQCPYCKGENLKETNHDYIKHIICEYDYYCDDCKEIVGHWAYGHAMP